MTSYTITVIPEDSATTTTLRLDTSGDGAKLTDLHLHAGDGVSIAALPAIDYGLLLQAITPATPPPILTAPAAAVREIASTPAPRTEPVAMEQPDAHVRQSTPRRIAGRRAASTAKAAAAEPVKDPRTRRGSPTAKKSAASDTNAGRAKTMAKAAPAKKATRAATGSERAYRRMPEDFATVYRQAGTAAAVADHYDVPRHTAHGWIRRLREHGAAPADR